MRNSMIAYHGSKNFDCGKIDTDYEGRWGSAMFFSFSPSLAREFSRGAELEHICTYEIPHSFSELFNPEDDYAVDALRDCLDMSIENKPLIDDTIKGVRNFDWGAFNPSSWIGQEIKTCLQGMGYVGWLEKEDGDDRLNFGLYSAEGVRLLNVEYFCDECDDALSKNEDHTLECEGCNLRLCVECGSEIEWDSDDSEWVWSCMCEDRRENPDSGILIKFSFRALQTYFEFANEFTYVADAKVLFAAFAQHIDLYRVLDQREMYIISTEGDFGGGDFNTEIERLTGAAFAATSIEDVVGWGKGWRKSGRLMGDLYVLEVDGFGRVFSHLNNPERVGIDMSGLRNALAEYQKGYISIEEGVEMSGLLDREYSVPRSEICTTGLGCSIALKEWDTFKVYEVVGDRVEELEGIPYDVDFPVLRTMYAIADTDAETLNDLMYEGVWGRGVYVTDNLDTATQDADRLGLGVFEVGLTIPEERGTVFEISKKNTVLGTRGSSLKRGMGGSLNAFVVDVLPADESGYAKKRLFVSQTPLDHTMLYDDFEREALVDQALEDVGIECGAQGYTSIGAWLRAIEYAEIVDCEGYEDLVFDIGGEEADEQLINSYNDLLRELAGLSSYDPHNVLRLSDTSKLGHVIKKRGYLAVRSRLNSPFDNYLCILDPMNLRSRVIADLEGDMS